ncbi:uncharacterized protein KY384_006555 [Bacidia gigantensis]|uniref:uncharacterized protein n=1 Tax=Bacidia gigantensis TaxID=2732470 RepID=UPI001D056FB8|nr:uncharacterized protein KY384_006555 [Bacidia gigantensis]KAG8528866.1 hypothetical protein KY384_006555 [Bacidia gigantensis]
MTKAPPPISIAPDGKPIYAANATLPDSLDEGYVDLRWGAGNCSMSPGYDGYNAKSCSCVNRIGDWYHGHATSTITTQQCQWSYIPGYATEVQSLGCSMVTSTLLNQNYHAPKDCCDKCAVRGHAVRLVYFPPDEGGADGKPAGNLTSKVKRKDDHEIYGVVSDGFTFISPSAYYRDWNGSPSRYESLSTRGAVYGSLSWWWQPRVGGDQLRIFISSAGFVDHARGLAEMLHQLDRRGLRSSTLHVPSALIPPDVTDIDPAWATWGGGTCTPIYLGVADPPRVLGQATALGRAPDPEQTDPASHGPQPVAAQPAGQASSQPSPTPRNIGDLPKKAPWGHKPASSLSGPSDQGSAKQPHAQPANDPNPPASDPAGNDPANAGQSAQNQGNNNPAAVHPAPASSSGDRPSNGGGDGQIGDPNQVSPQGMDSLHHALSPNPAEQDPQAQQAPSQQNSQAQSPNGMNVPNVQHPSDQGAAAANNGPNQAPAAGNEGNNPPSNSDSQSVPIPLIPVSKPSVDKGPVGGQGADTGLVPPSGQSVGVQTPQDGKASPQNSQPQADNQVEPIQSDGQPQSQVQEQPPISNKDTAISDPALNENLPFVNPPPQVGSHPVQKQANGNVVIGGTTIPEGQQATVDGHSIVNAPDHIVVDGETHNVAATPTTGITSAAPILQNNQVVQISSGGLQIAGQTLVPGSQVNLQGHDVNYVKLGQVVVDGTTNSLSPISTSNPLLIDSQTLNRAPNGDGIVIAGSTLAPSASAAAVISGHTYSMSGLSHIIADGKTYSLPPTENAYLVQAQSTSGSSQPSPVTLANGLVITPAPSSPSSVPQAYVLPNGATISPGGSTAVVSGTTYSALPSSGGLLVNGISTLSIPTSPPIASPSVFTVGGQIITASPFGFVLPNGASLSPGGTAVTVAGTTMSLGPSGSLVIGSSTYALSTPTSATIAPGGNVFTVGSVIFTAYPSGFTIAPGTIISPGGAATTISGTVVSLDSSGNLIEGSSTIHLGPQATGSGTGVGVGTSSVGIGGAIMGGMGPTQAPVASQRPVQGAAKRTRGLMGGFCGRAWWGCLGVFIGLVLF